MTHREREAVADDPEAILRVYPCDVTEDGEEIEVAGDPAYIDLATAARESFLSLGDGVSVPIEDAYEGVRIFDGERQAVYVLPFYRITDGCDEEGMTPIFTAYYLPDEDGGTDGICWDAPDDWEQTDYRYNLVTLEVC